jgi:hypothetical protein
MAFTDLILFPGEDEEKLKSEFIKLAAIYRGRYTHYELAQHVFKDLKEPELRAGQAGVLWAKDIDMQERIRIKIANGVDPIELSKDGLQAKILAVTEDPNLTSQDKKATLDGLRLLGEMNGWIIKAIDKKVESKVSGLPQIIIQKYANA